jgi:5'-3' exonuclease
MIEQPYAIDTFAVDADIVAYRCAAACEDETEQVLYSTIDSFISNFVNATKIKKLALCLSGNKIFRSDIAKTKPYKGNRDKIIRPKYLPEAKQFIRNELKGVSLPEYEADDLIATLMTLSKHVAHAGIDKDIKQIPGWHFNFVKYTWDYVPVEAATLQLFRQICSGDSSDNIPGLAGIGEKKAAKAVHSVGEAEQQALALYKLQLHTQSEQAIVEYFNEQRALIELVKTVPITLDVCSTYNSVLLSTTITADDTFTEV